MVYVELFVQVIFFFQKYFHKVLWNELTFITHFIHNTLLFTTHTKKNTQMQHELREAAAAEAERMAEDAKVRIDPLELKTLAELKTLEEEGGGYEDSRELEAYRQKRLAEMKAMAARNKFGSVFPLSRDDFVREVTEGSKESWVIVFLFQDHLPDSKALAQVLPILARKHASCKFMSIRADSCIEGYPDRNVPTLLLYHDGVCQSKLVGLADFGSARIDENSEYVFFYMYVCICVLSFGF
jgi:hypothetical protein